MRLLVSALALVLAAYAAASFVPVTATLAFGLDPFALSAERAALIERLAPRDIAVWLGAVLFYLLTASAILRRHPRAVWLYALAIGCDLFGWQVVRSGEAFNPAFAGAPQAGVVILAAHFIALALVMVWARGWGEDARQARAL